MVIIAAFQALGPGSIPGGRSFFLISFVRKAEVIAHWYVSMHFYSLTRASALTAESAVPAQNCVLGNALVFLSDGVLHWNAPLQYRTPESLQVLVFITF